MKIVIVVLLFVGLQLAAQDMQSCPMHKEHMKGATQHQADVEKAAKRMSFRFHPGENGRDEGGAGDLRPQRSIVTQS